MRHDSLGALGPSSSYQSLFVFVGRNYKHVESTSLSDADAFANVKPVNELALDHSQYKQRLDRISAVNDAYNEYAKNLASLKDVIPADNCAVEDAMELEESKTLSQLVVFPILSSISEEDLGLNQIDHISFATYCESSALAHEKAVNILSRSPNEMALEIDVDKAAPKRSRESGEQLSVTKVEAEAVIHGSTMELQAQSSEYNEEIQYQYYADESDMPIVSTAALNFGSVSASEYLVSHASENYAVSCGGYVNESTVQYETGLAAAPTESYDARTVDCSGDFACESNMQPYAGYPANENTVGDMEPGVQYVSHVVVHRGANSEGSLDHIAKGREVDFGYSQSSIVEQNNVSNAGVAFGEFRGNPGATANLAEGLILVTNIDSFGEAQSLVSSNTNHDITDDIGEHIDERQCGARRAAENATRESMATVNFLQDKSNPAEIPSNSVTYTAQHSSGDGLSDGSVDQIHSATL